MTTVFQRSRLGAGTGPAWDPQPGSRALSGALSCSSGHRWWLHPKTSEVHAGAVASIPSIDVQNHLVRWDFCSPREKIRAHDQPPNVHNYAHPHAALEGPSPKSDSKTQVTSMTGNPRPMKRPRGLAAGPRATERHRLAPKPCGPFWGAPGARTRRVSN